MKSTLTFSKLLVVSTAFVTSGCYELEQIDLQGFDSETFGAGYGVSFQKPSYPFVGPDATGSAMELEVYTPALDGVTELAAVLDGGLVVAVGRSSKLVAVYQDGWSISWKVFSLTIIGNTSSSSARNGANEGDKLVIYGYSEDFKQVIDLELTHTVDLDTGYGLPSSWDPNNYSRGFGDLSFSESKNHRIYLRPYLASPTSSVN